MCSKPSASGGPDPRDDLVTTLINNVYTSLADTVDAAWGAAPDAAHRVCTGITALAAAAWPHPEHLHADSDFGWADFDAGLLEKVRPAFPDLPPAAVALALRIWGHLHGVVSLEIYGHLQTQTSSPDILFRAELAQLIRSLGITMNG
ncbi:TetR-like C-terminal domain-containing protein [Streptomyces sp. NBC_00162]|uniref:TetR-like C-terminal domain-containing protein n=1 Tax=Streptomyces sp. NBC_00162 TaxID=2903629 RepID=UPI00214D1310|nr:TetR-like C-terminal domain-containing protein [Streptomyces sp. NBC_00162]UUU43951.1 WHG domain-containing protein [Streptomyces sp. NBC_00162]